ncbi:PH domain-containing protein, partial [Candidatus Woesearchaeota archaeon]|nr:PH domain-containing protein [Candidatus Woesearchaeota archaeon]
KVLYLNSLKYNLDQKNLTYRGGVISRFEKVIPYSKIQHVILYESFWQRILGLSSLSIETAREGGVNAAPNYQSSNYPGINSFAFRPTGPYIPDLKKEDAEKIKNNIMNLVNKYKSRAGV